MSVVSDPSREHRGSSGLRPPSPGGVTGGRVVGVDVARGFALLGMFAVHIFDTLHANNTPSLTHRVMAGHALATFVLLAGVSLTFITRRGRTASRWTDAPTAAALAVRALVILGIGLVLNSVLDPDIDVILPYYGLMFLFAIPLLRLPSRVLVGIAVGLVVLAPLVVTAGFGIVPFEDQPTFAALVHPLAALTGLLVTGTYPVVAYLAFICAGMVIGRLDLSSKLVAVRLAVGGAVLAVAGWFGSTLVLFRFGGLQHLRAAAEPGLPPLETQNIIVWEPDRVQSLWWLAERAPYTTTPFRMLHDLGVAMAWLGVCLLLTRLRLGSRLLAPLAAAGAMSLTLYTGQVVILSTSFIEDDPVSLYLVLVYVALSFAMLWRPTGRRGPLEDVVARASNRARRSVEHRQELRRGQPSR
ncbi:MAG: heparan-alpha-glucosaminide N-acetyltransferase domain-containing protein [Friedmanniella sp.]